MRDELPSHPKFDAISHARKAQEEDSGSLTVHEKDNMLEVWVGRVFSECFPPNRAQVLKHGSNENKTLRERC